MQYYYFVSYQYAFVDAPGKWGFGRMECSWPEAITRIEQLVELEKRITLNNPGTANIVMHYQLMRIESEAPTTPAHDAVSDQWPNGLTWPFKKPGGDGIGIQV